MLFYFNVFLSIIDEQGNALPNMILLKIIEEGREVREMIAKVINIITIIMIRIIT